MIMVKVAFYVLCIERFRFLYRNLDKTQCKTITTFKLKFLQLF